MSRQQGTDRETKRLVNDLWGSMMQAPAGRRAAKKKRRRADRAKEREDEAQDTGGGTRE